MFTDRDVDTVLYGYVRSPCDSADDLGSLTGHALSGLRVEQLSYGQYQLNSITLAGSKLVGDQLRTR